MDEDSVDHKVTEEVFGGDRSQNTGARREEFSYKLNLIASK